MSRRRSHARKDKGNGGRHRGQRLADPVEENRALWIECFEKGLPRGSKGHNLRGKYMTGSSSTDSSPQDTADSETFSLTVANKMGIHARPAAMIVRISNRYSGDVWVEKDGEKVNGKSIMGLMMLAAGPGSELRFATEGDDNSEFKKEMTALFEKKFEEA